MRQRLFPNIKHMTNMFCAGIILLTVGILVSRLTFLSGMAIAPPSSGMVQLSPGGQSDDTQADYLINSKIYFSAPDTKGNVLITNTAHNNNYIRVNIALNDSGKSVYYSGDIAPDTSINMARLQGDALAEGVYECTATITAYDPETRDKVGSEEVPVVIYIGIKPDKVK